MDVELINLFIKYYIAPMVANAMPVFIREGRPIDGGRAWLDGRRLLGDGKTWEGFITGFIGAYLASLTVSVYVDDLGFFYKALVASTTGLLGDIFGSFIKRRIGLKRGDPMPVLDQIDFALAATLAYILLGEHVLLKKPYFILYSLIAITLLHILTNAIAYMLKLKNKPW